jgi:hypothetical protein
VIYVVGKGRRPRRVAFGARTGRALDKYIRLLSRHPHASSVAPRLGPKGRHARERHCTDARAPMCPGGHGQGPFPPVPSHSGSHVASGQGFRGVARCCPDMALALLRSGLATKPTASTGRPAVKKTGTNYIHSWTPAHVVGSRCCGNAARAACRYRLRKVEPTVLSVATRRSEGVGMGPQAPFRGLSARTWTFVTGNHNRPTTP